MTTKQEFTAIVIPEDDWYVAQCLQIDIASQGQTEDEALANLQEALELHFEPPTAVVMPQTRTVEVELRAAA